VTKICPNCKKENSDNSKFCQDCGNELKETTDSVKSDKTSGGGIASWWNKQSKGGKTALGIVGVCCLGLIIVIAIGAMVSPDKNTTTTPSNTTTNTTPTTTPVSAVATFDNGIISFQYPTGTTINNATTDPADGVYIVTSNNAPGNGVLVTKEDKTMYDTNNQPDNGYNLAGTFKTSDGGSYKKWVETTPTYTNGPGSASFTLVDYEVVKNGNYYEILGTTTDGDIMNQIVNTIK